VLVRSARSAYELHVRTERPAVPSDGASRAALEQAEAVRIIPIVMSCEERFGVMIPNHAASGLATVGDAVRCVAAQIEAQAAPTEPERPACHAWRLDSALR